MLRKVRYTVISCLLCSFLFAQTIDGSGISSLNKWIDYSKTYYKFMLGPFGYDSISEPITASVVRIPQSTLAARAWEVLLQGNFNCGIMENKCLFIHLYKAEHLARMII